MASGVPNVHQKKLGPAPIASFEDLSEEVENGESAAAAAAAAAATATATATTAIAVGRMPGIVEVTTPATPGTSLKTPSTPRIDISRASSSSHHEDSNSRDSSPDRELLAGADPPSGCKLTLGYKEDAQDLRSSTEELDLQDPVHEQDLKRESKRRKRKEADGSQSDYIGGKQLGQDCERKDSNCSEICLLNISGRTSRLSSVGSQGSGVSGKLSVMSVTSSRSPSPHKCLLETSFCGSKPTLADNLIEPSKPETDDLEKILLKREADTTKALIPESIKVPMVGGNLKPDPLDKPRRRGREERKEIFKREVEITKRFLEKVNIEVPIIKKSSEQQGSAPRQQHQQHKQHVQQQHQHQHQHQQQQYQSTNIQIQEVQKPVTLDFNDKRKKTQNFKEIVQTTSTTSSLTGSPNVPRHQKVRDLEGSRTPSPSSVSRKSSFASLFKARTDGSVLSPESPSPSTKPRRSLTSKLKDTTESLRSRSKSRERVSIDKGSIMKKDSKNKGVFSSTLSLFKKRERKKSYDEARAGGSCDLEVASGDEHPSLESIGHVEFTFNTEKERNRQDDSIFISLHADDRNYEEALPSESVSIPLETPTKLLDEYESEGPHMGSIITEVSIEHHSTPSSSSSSSFAKIRTEAQIETITATQTVSKSSCRDNRPPQSELKDSHILKSSKLRDSKISAQANKIVEALPPPKSSRTVKPDIKLEIKSEVKSIDLRTSSSAAGLSRESTGKKPDIIKPKRKSKETQQQQQQPDAPEKINDDVGMQQKKISSGELSRTVQETKRLDLLDDKISKSLEQEGLVKTPSVISDLDHNSSESEKDSEIEFIRTKVEKLAEELPDERKGLFYEESFEEDLPYVPTTLPLEKSVAIPILPIKQRLQEVRTIPIERPRSTTPINPTLLDEFVMQTSLDERRVERMKISLPREDSFKLKSPRRQYAGTANTFTEFAGKVPPDGGRKGATNQGKSPSPPPLPPRASSSSSSSSSSAAAAAGAAATAARPSNWINFEEIPEKRKAPKRIQTIPRPEDEIAKTISGGYSYVQPEECKCECHEESRRASMREAAAVAAAVAATATSTSTRTSSCSSNGERPCNGENCTAPATGGSSVDRASIVSDSSLECSLSIDDGQSTQLLLGNSTKPFAMDLDVRSNRSSTVSQEENDETQHQS